MSGFINTYNVRQSFAERVFLFIVTLSYAKFAVLSNSGPWPLLRDLGLSQCLHKWSHALYSSSQCRLWGMLGRFLNHLNWLFMIQKLTWRSQRVNPATLWRTWFPLPEILSFWSLTKISWPQTAASNLIQLCISSPPFTQKHGYPNDLKQVLTFFSVQVQSYLNFVDLCLRSAATITVCLYWTQFWNTLEMFDFKA